MSFSLSSLFTDAKKEQEEEEEKKRLVSIIL